ncbi:metal-dependent hydrolase [Acinetobacter haemolyticus]|uniref:metal-dependent hydrolase n=1 Tax=Acinetobacter haemolyticus TaxID=29430 RepID=UPI000D6954E0|nr:metal-dependent hydrolase [Acinetobacter haemolyticus]
MNATAHHHKLVARFVRFDFSNSPVQWIPNDPVCSHLINGINLILPAGEFWFCRVYNEALPYVNDPILSDDVKGFIRQEATHARAHQGAQEFLRQHGYDLEPAFKKINWIFGVFLGESPLGIKALAIQPLEHFWLITRVGVVAAIEHFTGVLGQWCMDNKSWDKADPVIADMFRWHLAEEVEHRCVAYDLFKSMLPNPILFYLYRQFLMALVFPIFIYVLADVGRHLGRQDPDQSVKKIANKGLIALLATYHKQAKATDNGPTLTFLVKATIRWISPKFHPESEGNTQQALDYLARSLAVKAVN